MANAAPFLSSRSLHIDPCCKWTKGGDAPAFDKDISGPGDSASKTAREMPTDCPSGSGSDAANSTNTASGSGSGAEVGALRVALATLCGLAFAFSI